MGPQWITCSACDRNVYEENVRRCDGCLRSYCENDCSDNNFIKYAVGGLVCKKCDPHSPKIDNKKFLKWIIEKYVKCKTLEELEVDYLSTVICEKIKCAGCKTTECHNINSYYEHSDSNQSGIGCCCKCNVNADTDTTDLCELCQKS